MDELAGVDRVRALYFIQLLCASTCDLEVHDLALMSVPASHLPSIFVMSDLAEYPI